MALQEMNKDFFKISTSGKFKKLSEKGLRGWKRELQDIKETLKEY